MSAYRNKKYVIVGLVGGGIVLLGFAALVLLGLASFTSGPRVSPGLPNIGRMVKAHDSVRRFHLFQELRGHAERGNVTAIEKMLDNGVDPGFRGPSNETALHAAARRGQIPSMQVLLDRGADIDARDDRGQTPLHAAVRMNQMESVRFLLGAGANRAIRDEDERTALDWTRIGSPKKPLEDLLTDGTVPLGTRPRGGGSRSQTE